MKVIGKTLLPGMLLFSLAATLYEPYWRHSHMPWPLGRLPSLLAWRYPGGYELTLQAFSEMLTVTTNFTVTIRLLIYPKVVV